MPGFSILGLSVGDPLTTVAARLGQPDDVQLRKGVGCMWFFELEVDVWFLNETGRVTVVESRRPPLDREGAAFLHIGDTEPHVLEVLGPPSRTTPIQADRILDYEAENVTVCLQDAIVVSLTVGIQPA